MPNTGEACPTSPTHPPRGFPRWWTMRGANRADALPCCSACISSSGPPCRRCCRTISSSTWSRIWPRARVAARLLEASAAAVVGGRRDLSRHRLGIRGLSARAALRRRLHVCRVAARARHRRRLPGADRGRGAGGHPLLQFLGPEVRARPDAAAVLGADRPLPLSRDHARARPRLAARRRGARAVLLVEVCGLRARRQLGLFMLFDPGRGAPCVRRGRG